MLASAVVPSWHRDTNSNYKNYGRLQSIFRRIRAVDVSFLSITVEVVG
jgi:hypothetical protein